jgi:hypothetical protein
LEAVYAADAPMGLASLEAVQVLRATWVQQFYLDGGQVRWRDQQAGLPPGSRVILNPTIWTPALAANAAVPGGATRPPSPRRASPTGPTRVTHVATTDAATADLDTVPTATATSRPPTCCPTSTWSTRVTSASGRSWPRPTTTASS